MAYDRRSFAGGAVATTVTSGLDGVTLTIPIASATGWPSGSAGDFFAVINRGESDEEKVRVDTRSTLDLTLISGGRGVDGTSAVSHTTGATIELCLTAVDLDEANAHLSDTTLDHHTQYLDTTRHDVTARHAFGTSLPTPAAAADIGTAASAGAAAGPARADHVHKIGTGAIDTAGMFAAGVVDAAALAADSVDSAEIVALAVGTAELAANAVTTAKITDANVTAAKLEAAVGLGFLTGGYAAATTNQGSITTEVDLTSLTVTVTVGTSRRIRVAGYVRMQNSTVSSGALVQIKEGATVLQGDSARFPAANEAQTLRPEVILTPSAGSHTYKLTGQIQGSGTATTIASATSPAFIVVEDIGAA